MAYRARKTKPSHLVHIVLIAVVMAIGHILFSTPKQVYADNGMGPRITKERLEKLYKYSVESQLAGPEKAIEFADKHLHKNFESVIHLSTKIDNGPAQKETVVLTKSDYLRDIKKTHEVSTIEELKSGIVSYKINKNGGIAKVKDRTYSKARILLPAENGKSQIYYMRQFVNCDNQYILNENNVIQLRSSSCEIEGQLNKAQDL